MDKSNLSKLAAIVKARLEIENRSVICPVGKQPPAIKWNRYHKQALGIMLLESDSPFSASLRTFSAGVVGPLNISGSIQELTKICFSEMEDVRIRINATLSLLKFAEKGQVKNIAQVFESKTLQVRFVALKQALNSKNKRLSELGKKYLLKERSKEIVEILHKKYESTSMKYSTLERKKAKRYG